MTALWTFWYVGQLTLLVWTNPYVWSQEVSPEVRVVSKEVLASKCTSGVPGPPGPPGLPGATGDAGSTIEATPNWNSCEWWQINYSGQDHQIRTCGITKQYSDTYLYVGISTDMRLANGGNAQCCRWYFTFNGVECSSPVKIEAVVYANYYVSVNMHRPRMLIGFCKGISAGDITVGWHVGYCSGFSTAGCYSGWNSGTTMWIEEWTPSPYD